jgi:hypothetical protein
MYLTILALPSIGAMVAGLRGRALGVTGAQVITIGCMVLATLFTLVAFHEVALCRSSVTVDLAHWVSLVGLSVSWSLVFDDLTVAMLLPVLIVSLCVHVYSVSYMDSDPHQQRFSAYLSMFTAFMVLLVTADSYLLMFVGWEGIGISSFLLIGFWTTRAQAAKSAVLALTVNRVGDLTLTVAFLAMAWVFGSLDFALVLSTASLMDQTVLTITGLLLLGGAMAKSAQLPLHTWLPAAMEGQSLCRMVLLVCVLLLAFERQGDTSDLVLMAGLPPVLAALDPNALSTMTANMLGDGYVRRTSPTTSARFSMCVGPGTLTHLIMLFQTVYHVYCASGITSYLTSKGTLQYSFSTVTDPVFVALHELWYVFDPATGRYVKCVPQLILSLMTPLVLALWLIEDGYHDGVLILCTEGFTPDECRLLQQALATLGIKSGLKQRSKVNGTYRIRISKLSMPLVRELTLPHVHPQYHYKLGITPRKP